MWLIPALVALGLLAALVFVGGMVVTQIMRDEARFSDEWTD